MSEFESGNSAFDNYNLYESFQWFSPCFDEQRENNEFEPNDIYESDKSIFEQNENTPKLQSLLCENIYIKNIVSDITESTGLLTNKRDRDYLEDYKLQKEDENDEISVNIFYNKDKNIEIKKDENQLETEELVVKNYTINNEEKPKGRRKDDRIYDEKAKHTKFNEDNIMRKIKTFIFQNIIRLLNNSLIDKKKEFFPIETEISENLKKDLNLQLLNRTIKDIYGNSKLNERHRFRGDANKILINKILEENVELETIKILSMTYGDILNQIREKDNENFLEEIRQKESRKKKNTPEIINSYLDRLKNVLDNYENWFKFKLGRNTEKRNKKQTI